MPAERLTLNYSAAFLKQLKRLSKKYRRIRADLQPILEKLAPAERRAIRSKALVTRLTGSV